MIDFVSRPSKIFLVRHAEKPSATFPHGLNRKGESEKESLSLRGWQRAGALASFFAPSNGLFQHPALETPLHLYASKPKQRHGSYRPVETLLPLAEKLAVEIRAEFLKTDYPTMLRSVFLAGGTALISWQHDYISPIAAAIVGERLAPMPVWPDDRYDLVWAFTLDR